MKQFLDTITTRWKAFSPGQRIAVAAVVASVVAGLFVMQSRAGQVDWAVLYANLDDVTASDAMAQLDARGLRYQLDGNGTRILVPAEDLAATRLALAGDGVTGQAVPPGFEEVFAGQGLAASDFEQKVNYERALEGELSRTLLTMEPVRGANVQLSLPDDSIFVGGADQAQNPPSASVMLSLGRDLTAAEVDTVANVVAASVEGLDLSNVTIASSSGELLRAAGQDGSGGLGGSTSSSMDMTAEFEAALASRLTDLARTLTGAPTAQVQVRAELDFTESTVEQETIDPDTAMTTAEQVLTETWTGTGGAAGGAAGVDGGALAGGAGGDGTYQMDDRTTTFTPGDRTITRSTTSTPTLNRLSVAVVVPVAAAEDGTITPPVDDQTVQRVLASAAGLDQARGDTIEVASVPANAADTGELITEEELAPTTPVPSGPMTMLPGIGIGVGLMVVIGFLARRRRKKKAAQVLAATSQMLYPGGGDMTVAAKGRKAKKAAKAGAVAGAAAGVGVGAAATMQMPMGRPVELDPDHQAVEEIRADLERMLSESPESLAALLSAWMAK